MFTSWNRYWPKNCGILNKCTGGGSAWVYARKSTEMSAGLRAPRDNIAARAVRALRQDSPDVSANVMGVTSCPLWYNRDQFILQLTSQVQVEVA